MNNKEKLIKYRELLYLLNMLKYVDTMEKIKEEEKTKEKSKVLVLKKKFYGRDLVVG